MKTSIAILSALSLALAVGNGQEQGQKEHQGGKHHRRGNMFEKVDTNHDGTISLDEFLATPRGKKNPEKATKIFKRIDANSDGKITKEEMADFHAKHMGHHKGKHKKDDGGSDATQK